MPRIIDGDQYRVARGKDARDEFCSFHEIRRGDGMEGEGRCSWVLYMGGGGEEQVHFSFEGLVLVEFGRSGRRECWEEGLEEG